MAILRIIKKKTKKDWSPIKNKNKNKTKAWSTRIGKYSID